MQTLSHTTTTFTLPSDRVVVSQMLRPFVVVHGDRTRSFGSLRTARKFGMPGDRIFFEYEAGCGSFVELVGG